MQEEMKHIKMQESRFFAELVEHGDPEENVFETEEPRPLDLCQLFPGSVLGQASKAEQESSWSPAEDKSGGVCLNLP